MKVIKYLFLTMSVCMLFVTMSFAQQTETVNKKIYQNVEIEKFTIRTGVEFPADKIDALTNVVAGELRETKRFNQVSIAGDAVAQPATETVDLSTMKITGEVVKFDKGNRAMRYIVGMGTGKTKIIVNVKFIDAKTGETMMEQIVDGDISKGIFGGNTSDARSEVADEIVKIMKRNFTEDKKKKSK